MNEKRKESPSDPEGNPKGPADWITILLPILVIILTVMVLLYANLVRTGFFR